MFFYLLIIPSLAIIMVTMLELLVVQKHDKVLYSYCQLRRNINLFLRTEGLRLPDHEYRLINRMLDFVGITIHDFHHFKKEVFNFRNAKKLAKASVRAQHKKDIFTETNNKDIGLLQSQFRFCIVQSIFAYTPFLRHEIVLKVIYSMGELLAKLSLRRGKKILKYVDIFRSDIEWFKKPEHHYDLFDHNHC